MKGGQGLQLLRALWTFSLDDGEQEEELVSLDGTRASHLEDRG